MMAIVIMDLKMRGIAFLPLYSHRLLASLYYSFNRFVHGTKAHL